MYHRILLPFLTAAALSIGLMGLAPSHAQGTTNTPRQGKGRWQGAHARRPQGSTWGAKSGTRQANRKNSVWGNSAGSVQPPSPWSEKRGARGVNINPPSPWTPTRSATHPHLGAGKAVNKGQRQVFHYGSHPTHPGKWTATHSHDSLKSGRWKQNTTPGAWKLKQKSASQNWKSKNRKQKNDSQAPIQTGLPNR